MLFYSQEKFPLSLSNRTSALLFCRFSFILWYYTSNGLETREVIRFGSHNRASTRSIETFSPLRQKAADSRIKEVENVKVNKKEGNGNGKGEKYSSLIDDLGNYLLFAINSLLSSHFLIY